MRCRTFAPWKNIGENAPCQWRAARSFARLAGGAAADRAAALGIVAAGLAIALYAAVDSFLSFAPIYVLFSLTLGYAVASARGVEAP